MNQRPSLKNRNFTCKIIEDIIVEISDYIDDKEIAQLFGNAFPNTLDTTISFKKDNGKPDTYVITGDINAMWLRDSTAQVSPYLSFINKSDKLKELIAGLINRQTSSILLDPYANAFYENSVLGEWKKDLTEMKPGLHERKWEIDSLCYPIRLAYQYWKTSEDTSCFDKDWQNAMKLVVATFITQQRKNGVGPYKFGRTTAWSTDTVPGNGYGNPIKPNGLIASIFRPSDDATIFPFLIPSNFFAVISLKQLAEIFQIVFKDEEYANVCLKLGNEVENAIMEHAVFEHPEFGNVFAYEVDGFGNRLFMDDANIPSLLSLPYLGCISSEDPIYINTRALILSNSNPYFFIGDSAEGIGSPHTLQNKIWPMSIVMRALTSNDANEIIKNITFLKNTHAETFFMHESFDKDNPKDFTREWFAWVNSLFGELIVKLYSENKELLKRDFN